MAIEENMFKDTDLPLEEPEDEFMEDEEEDEELDALEKENEEIEEDQDPEDDEEDDDEEDDDEEDGEKDEDDEPITIADEPTQDTAEPMESVEPAEPLQESAQQLTETKELPKDDDKVKKYFHTLEIKARVAESYDILPTVALPYAAHVHTMALSRGNKWLFTGGQDGFIRKYDFYGSLAGEVQLTAAQRHPLVDIITNGGVLSAYWENEIPVKRSEIKGDTYEPKLSPVYSLAVENSALWVLGGLSSGGINLQSVRHNEGTIIHHFKEHTNAVSVLQLNEAQDKFLSGGWDHNIFQWDLNTGGVINSLQGSSGQLSSLEFRPNGGISIDKIQQVGEDDDMDSLFGDEDDAPEVKKEHEEGTTRTGTDENVFMSSSMDGSLYVWDVRTSKSVLRLRAPKGTPPWCVSACWAHDGNSIFAGRRNSTVEEFSLKMPTNAQGEPKPSKTLRFPPVSGAVTAVRTMPNLKHVVCGSFDNIRIYDLTMYADSHKKTPFLIIPGHHGGTISQISFDPTYRYMLSASGNRGWHGTSTETAFVYEVAINP